MATAAIYALRTVSGNAQNTNRMKEEAGQTYLGGTPLMVNQTDGGIQAWNGVTPLTTNLLVGFSRFAAGNLATTGVPKQATFPGGVPNQPLAQNISRPYFNDGTILYETASLDNVFFGQIGPAQSLTGVLPGNSYGMTIDTDGHWFVDTTKTGTGAVVKIVELDAVDTVRGVHFQILPAAAAVTA